MEKCFYSPGKHHLYGTPAQAKGRSWSRNIHTCSQNSDEPSLQDVTRRLFADSPATEEDATELGTKKRKRQNDKLPSRRVARQLIKESLDRQRRLVVRRAFDQAYRTAR